MVKTRDTYIDEDTSFPERIKFALELYDSDRKRVTDEDCWTRAGISRSTFYQALRARSDPDQHMPHGQGRIGYIPKEDYPILYQKVTEKSINLQAPTIGQDFATLVKDQIKESCGNPEYEPSITTSYLLKLRKGLRLIKTENADVKSEGRLAGFKHKIWRKCDKKNCNVKFCCSTDECLQMSKQHVTRCDKVPKKKRA